jgi:hypothetical protein
MTITKGHYTGFYKYNKERIQKIIAHDKTLFFIDINDTDGEKFSGTIQDDINTGGTPGIGTITGKINGDKIFFVKQMPIAAIITNDVQKNFNKKHRKIYYDGIKSDGIFKGTWKLKFGFIFFGLLPILIAETRGTWEMKKKSI